MTETADLIKTTVEEIERILNAKTVVGQSTTLEGFTIIPLISVGFGFGLGAGIGKCGRKEKGEGEGSGSGSGGGGGVRPVALIIIDKTGVRVEPVKSGFTHAIESIGTTIPHTIEKISEKIMEMVSDRFGKKGKAAGTGDSG